MGSELQLGGRAREVCEDNKCNEEKKKNGHINPTVNPDEDTINNVLGTLTWKLMLMYYTNKE